ncbi:signal peptidase II [Trichlorobacter lovleyi]|uniref:signal peptidase II n=1 Tax=Trichlorobacter lovleyi TaxID=313985 RepID=UPI00223F4AB4|nr:signal peptidase II [Trichlorobacter lovleyi]QOX78127.1 signal peptidase II [Trichlorobacter lovleyi]
MNRWTIFSVIAGLGLVVDQATKLYVDRVMALHQSIPVVEGLFSFTYLRNRGAAFSFLSNVSWRLPFFIGITLIAALVIIVALKKMRDDQKLAQAALAMIFSGAIGNLIDRVRLGEVIDFLDVYWKSHHWPAFNVADSLICVGVALVALDMLKEERNQPARAE